MGQADNDSQTSTTPATTTPTTTTTTTATAAAAAAGGPGREDDSHVIDLSTTPPVSALVCSVSRTTLHLVGCLTFMPFDVMMCRLIRKIK